MLICKDWKDYELIDCSNGEKLERWGDVFLLRPDPQIIWDNGNLRDKYDNINAHYHRSNKGGGSWENLKHTKPSWTVNYKNLTFNIKEMGFKHTGLFPEQAINWDYMIDKIKNYTNVYFSLFKFCISSPQFILLFKPFTFLAL